MKPTKRKLVIILAVLLCLVGGVSAVWYAWIYEPVYFRIITESEQGILSDEANNWLQNNNQEKGLHLYALEQNPYELLLHYNINNVNSYTTPSMEALWVEGTLHITISEDLASDDVLVDNELTAYFILQQKPDRIEVYMNGKKKSIVPETGDFAISA